MRLLVRSCSRTSASGLRNRALITVFYRAGLRVKEALALGLESLDREERIIRVDAPAGARRVRLDAGAFLVIERWVEKRSEIGVPTEAPLFCTLAGGALSSSYVRGMLGRLSERAGIGKRASAELLRRSLALELASEGFSLIAIQAQLGHSNPLVTSRYLARIGRGDAGDVVRGRSDWMP